MKDKYADGQSTKELLRKNKNNNRKIKQEVARAASYDRSKQDSSDSDEWDDYEDVSFEKFRNGKR
tara:strand:- start:19 stop:213 length:195 start_codon:yes stop_codon:yes gene_type:complete